MKKEIEVLALQISQYLAEEEDPYTRVEIDSDGVKVIVVDEFIPRHYLQMKLPDSSI